MYNLLEQLIFIYNQLTTIFTKLLKNTIYKYFSFVSPATILSKLCLKETNFKYNYLWYIKYSYVEIPKDIIYPKEKIKGILNWTRREWLFPSRKVNGEVIKLFSFGNNLSTSVKIKEDKYKNLEA